MPDLSVLSTASVTALGLSNLILVTPEDRGYQPQNPNLQDGSQEDPTKRFLFHYEGEQSVNLMSDITDHFAEDNKSLQDQIALRPVIVTTHGFIGELNNVTPKDLSALKFAAQKLTVISAYTPVLSATALIAYNNALSLYTTGKNLKNNAVAAWDSINGENDVTVIDGLGVVSTAKNQNEQQKAFSKFFGYWSDRTLFTVQTPWAIFKNMAIQSLRAVQSEETRVITDFELTFKQMRFAETIVLNANNSNSLYDTQQMQGRAYTQGSSLRDLGSSTATADGLTLNSMLGSFQ